MTFIDANRINAGTLGANVILASNINATQINAGTLNSGVIYSGTINADRVNAGTMNAVNLNWAGFGSLTRTTGNDGQTTTNLIHLLSQQGMRIEATGGGMNLVASGGIWTQSPVWIAMTNPGGFGTVHRNLRTQLERLFQAVGLQI